ncbi:hypothetical protein H2204_005081 [Knufia peltigerae]|uniref:Uncharacterized protein n=1 Tax=Knufia peltigerae TaxID=1002370 RepID=A0AA39CZ32_9EURO|nr:hypothetical protein H2204_005081 [Knufia peltigerae]
MCQWWRPGVVVYYQCGHQDEAPYTNGVPDVSTPEKCDEALLRPCTMWCDNVPLILHQKAPTLDWYKVCLSCHLKGVTPLQVDRKDLPTLHDWRAIWAAMADKELFQQEETRREAYPEEQVFSPLGASMIFSKTLASHL